MPELETMETPKNAGFVQRGSNYTRKQKRMEEEEKEIARLEAIARGEIDETEEGESSSEDAATSKVQASGDTEQKETNSEAEAQEDDVELKGEERTYKKRYSDLRKHMNKQTEEIKKLKASLENVKEGGEIRVPKSDEDIAAWAQKYPDVAAIVERIAEKKAQEKFATAEDRLQEIDRLTAQSKRAKLEDEIRSMHSDFDTLRDSDDFHDWAGEQPKWVQDALYENQDDPKSVVRVIDLYKVDKGLDTKTRKRNNKDAASAVVTKRTTKLDSDSASGTFSESQVNRMTAEEYEQKADAIMESIRAGKFVYDMSGGAR